MSRVPFWLWGQMPQPVPPFPQVALSLLEALAEPGAAPLPQGHPGLALGRGSLGELPGQPLTLSGAWIRGGPHSPHPDLPVRHVACPGTFFQ